MNLYEAIKKNTNSSVESTKRIIEQALNTDLYKEQGSYNEFYRSKEYCTSLKIDGPYVKIMLGSGSYNVENGRDLNNFINEMNKEYKIDPNEVKMYEDIIDICKDYIKPDKNISIDSTEYKHGLDVKFIDKSNSDESIDGIRVSIRLLDAGWYLSVGSNHVGTYKSIDDLKTSLKNELESSNVIKVESDDEKEIRYIEERLKEPGLKKQEKYELEKELRELKSRV